MGCRPCVVAKHRCVTLEGGAIKVARKKMEDLEEGSSGGKKQKRKKEEEIEVEFSLVVEELWRRVERRWEESERWQEQWWNVVMAVLGQIMEDVGELLDGLVPEEKEKDKEKGTEEMEAEEAEEMGAGMEKDGDGDMEVEETLKETEKSADEVERVGRDVMEE